MPQSGSIVMQRDPADHPDLLLLAEFHLQYRKNMARVTSGDARVGAYLGSGDGVASGAVLTGRIEWDLFEAQGDTLCVANFKGMIETPDGPVIDFESLGFFRRPAQTGKIWTMSGSVTFDALDKRFKVLTERPAVWEGVFDMNTYTHHYLIYRKPDKSEDR
jgi:hypothetical protein